MRLKTALKSWAIALCTNASSRREQAAGGCCAHRSPTSPLNNGTTTSPPPASPELTSPTGPTRPTLGQASAPTMNRSSVQQTKALKALKTWPQPLKTVWVTSPTSSRTQPSSMLKVASTKDPNSGTSAIPTQAPMSATTAGTSSATPTHRPLTGIAKPVGPSPTWPMPCTLLAA